jgi:hypothetical protein
MAAKGLLHRPRRDRRRDVDLVDADVAIGVRLDECDRAAQSRR